MHVRVRVLCPVIKESLDLIKQWTSHPSTHPYMLLNSIACSVWASPVLGHRWLQWFLYPEAITDADSISTWAPAYRQVSLTLLLKKSFCCWNEQLCIAFALPNQGSRKSVHIWILGRRYSVSAYMDLICHKNDWIYSLSPYGHLKILTIANSSLQDTFDPSTPKKKKQKTYC